MNPVRKKYRRTIYSCYMSNVAVAFLASTPPILYITLREMYGLSFEQLGRLALLSSLVSLFSALFFSRLADKYGARRFILFGQAMTSGGFFLYGLAPYILPGSEYVILTVATLIMAVGMGLFELLLSPIVNAIPLPEKEKAGAMTMLHSFFAWGCVFAVLLTTLLLALWGRGNWNIIVLLWAAMPLVAMAIFLGAPLAPMVPEEKRMKIRDLLKSGMFILVLLCIITGGATEVSMSHWASSFIDAALSLPKVFGDVAGVCMFSVMLGLGRSLYSKISEKVSMETAMLFGGIFAVICYVAAAISPFPILSLIMCALCGLAASLLWPGSIVLASARFPLAGTTMFAMLSAGGMFGAAIGPWFIGAVADFAPQAAGSLVPSLSPESFGLRAGLLLTALFPLGLIFCVRAIQKKHNNHGEAE